MSRGLISVIVPVNHNKKELKESLESVLSQTYKNLEIILADDGQSEEASALCDEDAASEDRIRIIRQKGEAISDLMNAGLQAASGDFISFLKGKDVMDPKMMESLVNAIETSSADMAQCAVGNWKEGNAAASKCSEKNKVYSSKKWLIRKHADAFENSALWNKLYKRQLFHRVRFPEGENKVDEVITYRLADHADRIVENPSVLYFVRDDHTSESVLTQEKLESQFDFMADRYRYFFDKCEFETAEFYLAKLMKFMIHCHKFNVQNGFHRDWYSLIRQEYPKVLISGKVSFGQKLYILNYLMFPGLVGK